MTTNLGSNVLEKKFTGWHGHEASILVEDGNAAEGTAQPLGMVFLKLGVHGLQERANEGRLEQRTGDATLVEKVRNYGCVLEACFCLSRCTVGRGAHTLVVDDAHGDERQEQSPWTGRGDCVNDIVNLRRKTSSRELGSSKHGAKGRRRVDGGSHCIDGWPGRADKCIFRATMAAGGRGKTRSLPVSVDSAIWTTTEEGRGPGVGGGSGQRKEMKRKE